MRILKTRVFDQWANKEGLTDLILTDAVDEKVNELVEIMVQKHE